MFIIVIDNVYIRHECDNKIFDKFSLSFISTFSINFPTKKVKGLDMVALIYIYADFKMAFFSQS